MVKSAASITESLCQQIQDQILLGELSPGMRLSEREMARHYGVSRTPMREVFITLFSQRLVELRPDGGIYVRESTPEDIIEAYQIRLGLDSVACGLAAKYATAEQVAKIGEYIEKHKRLISQIDSNTTHQQCIELLASQTREIEGPLHDAIGEAAGNDELNHMIHLSRVRERCWKSMSDFYANLPVENIRQIITVTINMHIKIYEAIKTHDVKEAVRNAFLHIRVPLDLFLQSMNKKPTLPPDAFDELITELDGKSRQLNTQK